MVSRGNFDEIIKQEQAGFRSSRNQDSGENARDRAARRLNVKSGKNPNPRTSFAYKPDKPAAKKSKPAPGKNKPSRGKPSSGGDPQLPDSAPTPSSPDPTLPVVDPGKTPWWIPFLVAAIARRKGGPSLAESPDAGGGEPRPPGTDVIPHEDQSFRPLRQGAGEGGTAPMNEVPLSRVPPDAMSENLLNSPTPDQVAGTPSSTGVDPQDAEIQRQLMHDPSALNESNVGRFFNEGELSAARKGMKGVELSPGWGGRKPPAEFKPRVPLR